MALGYKVAEAEKSVLRVLKTVGEGASVEELVKGALQK